MATKNREQLLLATARGDAAAFEALYDATAAQLFAVLLRMLKRQDVAEEALQDVFVNVWNKADRYRESQGKALTWMTSIARNRAVDILRRSKREVSLEPKEAEQIPADSVQGIDPEVWADETARAQRLRHCLEELTPDQQRSIRLAFFDGFSHGELAESLDTPLGTVKSWVRRGLEHLKDCLRR